MSTIHVFDIHDFLKAELRTDTACVAAGVRVSGSKVQRFLSAVKAGDQVIFAVPMHDKKFMQRLSASNMGEGRILLPGINPSTVLEQLAYMRRHNIEKFFPAAAFVAVLDFNELDKGADYCTAALPNYRVDEATGSVSVEAPTYREENAEDHVQYYSSDEGFARNLEKHFKAAGSHSQAHLAAAGQLWPAHKREMLEDIRNDRVACVVSDVDETFLLTGLTAVVETNLCHGCDRIHQRLVRLFADITGYPEEGSSQQRFAFLKSQLVADFDNGGGRLSKEAFDSFQAELAQLHDQELYCARLDQWFNALRSSSDIPEKYITQMDEAYKALVAQERAGAFGEREKQLRNMLVYWSENPSHTEALKLLAQRSLTSLDALGGRLYYKPIVSKDDLECLHQAKRAGADTVFITSRPRPLPENLAAIDSFALGSAVSSMSREDVRKPDKQLQQMSESASYLDSRHHHCHQNGPGGEILGPVHYSTKMMYHTIRMILTGKKFNQAETKICWLMDDNPYETHPELVRQCNALFALQGMNLRWKVAVPCQGGEYLLDASPRPELAAYEADKSASMCEHCLPSKLLELITRRYAALGGGAEIDEAKFQQAYDEAWHQVSLVRSTPAPARVSEAIALVPSEPSVTRQSIASMDKALAEIAARRSGRSLAAEARTVKVTDVSTLFAPVPSAADDETVGLSLDDLDVEGLTPAEMAARVKRYLSGEFKP